MRSFYARMRLFVLAVTLVTCAGLWAYKWYFVWPRDRCEAAGDWWDAKDHRCGVPIAIWKITGRTPPAKPADAAGPGRP